MERVEILKESERVLKQIMAKTYNISQYVNGYF